MQSPIQANTGRKNTELNACEICAPSDVPTYKKAQKPIQINTYIYYFNCKMIRGDCPAVGWVRGKRFQVDVPIERLHVIHMNLKDCIGFSEREHPFKHSYNVLRTGSSYHS